MKKHHPALALLITASAGVAGAAAPETGSENLAVRSATISYNSAEISNDKSAERLFFRIRQAAEEVCRIASHPVGYEIWKERACETDAVSQAVSDADLPALDSYYSRVPGSTVSLER